jgi:hypothetical protein
MDREKLKIAVFVPLSACACVYSHYLDRVWEETIPYKEYIEFEVKDIRTSELDGFTLLQNSIIIYNPPNRKDPIKLTSFLEFRKFLQDQFKME